MPAADRPDLLMLTGGEPLLLPRLVTRLAAAAHEAGSRVAVLTGAFFAGGDGTPPTIRAVVEAVDHFSVSVDAFHEQEIPRENAFRLLREVMDAGTPVSIHTVGAGDDDPYLADLVADVDRVLGDGVPILVNTVRRVGRHAGSPTALAVPRDHHRVLPRVLPCAMASWPVVAADGEIVACCNQSVVDRRPVPRHLSLGHAATDDWAAIRARADASPVLQALRSAGPLHIRARAGVTTGDYCAGCRSLSEDPAAEAEAIRVGAGAVGRLLADHAARIQIAAGPAEFVRRHGSVRYAQRVTGAAGAAESEFS